MTQAGRDGSHDGGTYGSAVAAEGWQRVAGRTDLQPITERMLDLAGVGSGHRVLDVAAGTGEQTLMAARRVGSHGFVLATDIADRMLAYLDEAARNEGLANLQTRLMDARLLELEPEIFRRRHLPIGADAHPRAGKGVSRNTTRAQAGREICRDCPVDGREAPSHK